MSGRSRSSLPDPFVDIGVVGCTGSGVGVGGVGDLLGAVSVVEHVDRGVGAVSVLDEYLVLGTVPEVDGLGEDGVVLGLEEVFEEVADDGSLARAEVLAFGGLIGMAGTGAGAGVGFLAAVLVAGVGALETVCC
jgi:hypothetical protein